MHAMVARTVAIAALLCACRAGRSGPAPLQTGVPYPPPEPFDTLVGGERVYLESEVDSAAWAIFEGHGPRYPDSLKSAGVTGAVAMAFIVNELGGVEIPSVALLSSTHRDFTESVLRYLPTARFKPAVRAGRPVRLWVRQVFEFRLEVPGRLTLHFAAVAVDWDADQGINYLREFGKLDEVSSGGQWWNTAVGGVVPIQWTVCDLGITGLTFRS